MVNHNKDELIPLYSEIISLYTNDATISSDKDGYVIAMHRCFNSMICKMNDPTIPLNIFSQLATSYPENEFATCKAYAIYNAYQIKNYSKVEAILGNFYIYLNSKDYSDYVDFITMNYFKGLIFLSQLVRINA
jgi:hypothetical protein